MTRPVLVATLLSVAAFALAPSAPGETLELMTPVGSGHRIWIEAGENQPGPRAELRIQYPEMLQGGDVVEFEVEIHSDDLDSEGVLTLELYDAGQTVVQRGAMTVLIREDFTIARFEWNPLGIPNGVYSAWFTLGDEGGEPLAAREVVVRILSSDELVAQSQALQAGVTALKEHLANLKSSGVPVPPYAEAKTVLAEEYAGAAMAAFAADDWRTASAMNQYTRDMVNSVRVLLSFEGFRPELRALMPDADLATLAPEAGALVAQGRPVFLFGAPVPISEPERLAHLRTLGLNATLWTVTPEQLSADPNWTASVGAAFDAATRNNVSVTVQLLPGASGPDVASTFDVYDTAWRERLGAFLQSVSDAVAGHDIVNSVSLAYEPHFRMDSEIFRQSFQDHVSRLYEDYDALNRAWRKRLRGFEEVGIWWDYLFPAYQYELQLYQQAVVTDFFGAMAERMRQTAPRVPATLVLPDNGFERGESRGGINREDLLATLDLAALSGRTVYQDERYVWNYPHTSMNIALLRSLAPDKALMNLSYDIGLPEELPNQEAFRLVHSAVWEAAICGMNGCVLAPDSAILRHPGALEAFSTAALDINRLAPVVDAFQQAPVDVAIIWSTSSKIFGDGDPYLASAERAYEGSTFFGYKTGFVSEEMAARHGLEQYETVIVPNMPAVSDGAFVAIQQYLLNGGAAIRRSKPIPYEAHGASRQDVLEYTHRTMLVRGDETPLSYLSAMDGVHSFGVLPEIPRIINAFGYPLEGVLSRFVAIDGESYLFVLNLRHDAVQGEIYGAYSRGRDLIQGRAVAFPMSIEPLDPMLIRLETGGVEMPAAPLAAMGEDAPLGAVPVAKVHAVPQETPVHPERQRRGAGPGR